MTFLNPLSFVQYQQQTLPPTYSKGPWGAQGLATVLETVKQGRLGFTLRVKATLLPMGRIDLIEGKLGRCWKAPEPS